MKKLAFALRISMVVFNASPLLAMEDLVLQDSRKAIPQIPSWEFLRDGDRIEIIAPSASPLKPEQLAAARDLISQHGLKASVLEGMLNPEVAPYNYYANTHEERAKAFINALSGPSKVVWALLGGFGGAEIVEILERSSFVPPAQPKLIIGFSDITALHLLADRWGWSSLHAPVLSFGKEVFAITQEEVNKDADLVSVIKILKGELSELEYTLEVIHPGNSSSEMPILGSIMGGNLSLIENHSGTKTALQGEERFIFLEDTPENGTRLNRRLMNLLRTGVFDKAKGLIIGYLPIDEFENSPQGTKTAIHQFVTEFLLPRGINIPVIYSPRFGHGVHNDVLPLGTAASLSIHEEHAILKVSVSEL